MPTEEEMTLAARLVHAGVVGKDQARQVLAERDAVRASIGSPSLLDLLVKRGWITRTELMIFRDRPLEEIQPFPKYLIHGKVAEGGMAMVYRATYKPLDVDVVLKVMKAELSRQDRFLLRFRREAGILMKLEHPSIVRGYDLGEQERVWYCAMEFAEGTDLQTRVETGGPMKEVDALHAVIQVARAVDYLDSRGIVHRDLKPSNIVMDDAGACRIIDLGLCLLRGGMKEDTGAGVTVGTVEYLSPEQARAVPDLDVRSDLYSLGATLHHLVTGEVPFKGRTDEETLAKQVLATFRLDRLAAAGVTRKFADLVARLLAKDREQRFPDARSLVAAMEASWPVLQPPAPAPLPSGPPPAAPAAPAAPPPPPAPKFVPRKEREGGEGGARSRGKRR